MTNKNIIVKYSFIVRYQVTECIKILILKSHGKKSAGRFSQRLGNDVKMRLRKKATDTQWTKLWGSFKTKEKREGFDQGSNWTAEEAAWCLTSYYL